MGQRIPEAAAELLAELRAQTKAAGEYHRQVDVRLASLPQEIASGVDVGAIAETMSEAFRQQLAATGLRDSAVSLDSASRATKALAGQIFGTLKPASEDLKALTATISTELVRLAEASSEIQRHNHRLILRDRSQRWVWQGVAALALFLFGGLAGIVMEKRETTNVLTNMASQIERVQTPVSPTVQVPRKNRKQGGLQQQLNEQQQIQGKPR
jgi:hypothetical protein